MRGSMAQRFEGGPQESVTAGQPDPAADPVEELFRPLRPVVRVIQDPTTPTPGSGFDIITAFPDPADTNVFWAQPLVVEMAKPTNNTQFALTSEAFEPYLYGLGEHSEGRQP